MSEAISAEEIWTGRWSRIRVHRKDGVSLMVMHSNGGSLIWDAEIHRELPEALLAIDADEATKVLILSGCGDNFCNEIDITSFDKLNADWNDVWVEGRAMLDRHVGLSIPIVAIVNGPARIHAELAVLADVVLAAPDAQFADLAHFTRGSVPGDGVHIVWPHLLGPSRGRYFLMTGGDISAEEALRIGFVHEIHPRGVLEERAWEIASGFARWPRSMLQYTRSALSLGMRRYFAEDLSHGLALQGQGFWSRKVAAMKQD